MGRLLRSPWVRLVPVALVALGVQRGIAAQFRVADVAVQVVLALAVAIGVGVGSERGGLAGFVLGAMTDLAVGSPLGTHALAYGLAAMTAGSVRSITPDPQWWLGALFAALGAAVGEFTVASVRLFLGDGASLQIDLVRIVLVVALAAAVLSPLFVPLGRWCMGVRRTPWRAIPE
jgi:rod shape-determining protein MreD